MSKSALRRPQWGGGVLLPSFLHMPALSCHCFTAHRDTLQHVRHTYAGATAPRSHSSAALAATPTTSLMYSMADDFHVSQTRKIIIPVTVCGKRNRKNRGNREIVNRQAVFWAGLTHGRRSSNQLHPQSSDHVKAEHTASFPELQ